MSSGRNITRQDTDLNPRKSQKARFLGFQPLVHLVGVVAVHVRFLHERECYAVVNHTECGDFFVIAWFLPTELRRL
jgi:hypothetical protein